MPCSSDGLDEFAFLRELGPEARARLVQELMPRTIAPGAGILCPGDAVDGVYLVRAGSIRVYYLDAEGREGTLYWIGPGQSCILALNSFFTKIPYPAWAEAEAEGVELLSSPGPAFRMLFAAEPVAQRFVFEQLSARVFELLRLLEKTMRLPQEERLILLLLSQADADGVVHLSQERIARHLGTIREVVSRLLRHLAARGLIALAPRRVQLLDRLRLARMASGGSAGGPSADAS